MTFLLNLSVLLFLIAAVTMLVVNLSGHEPGKSRYLTPGKAFGDCITPSQAVDFAARDQNRILGNVAMVIARKSPYVNLLDGGTLPNGVSEVTRSVVQERAVLGHSLTRPTFIPDTETCGTAGPTAQVGSTEYDERLETIRGRGPRVCVKTTRTAFKGSYSAAEDAMKKQLVQLNNADVRATLVDRSGLKLVVHTGSTFSQMFTGDSQAIDTPFATELGVPDAQLNFKLLKYARDFMREDLLVEAWEGDDSNEPIFRFVGGQQQIEKFRDELDIKEDHRSLASGSFKAGEKFIKGYSWEGPYRGFAFGIDPQPLRFSQLDENGQPLFIEPEISVPTSNGVGARISPAWARARYEVGLLVGGGSFRRRTPEQYTGEGSWRWPAQLAQGELEFVVIRDNDCNLYGDFGQHIYQISRSYKPERPHHVMAIIYKRCETDFGLATCPDYANYSSTDSL